MICAKLRKKRMITTEWLEKSSMQKYDRVLVYVMRNFLVFQRFRCLFLPRRVDQSKVVNFGIPLCAFLSIFQCQCCV